MEQRNEPSTAEIVKALRDEARFELEGQAAMIHLSTVQRAIDRLERLERDLETFKAFHERYAEQTSKKYVEDVCALTARAEKAEAERDAAIIMFQNAMRGVEGIKRGQQDGGAE